VAFLPEHTIGIRSKLSTLWIFATLNYLYCDVAGLMDRKLLTGYLAGNVNGLEVSQGFLLGAGVLVEIPIAMVLLSRVLKYRANRWANVAAGTVMTVVQLATLFLGGSPTMYYLFFSVIEIATTAYIVWLAWKWSETAARMEQLDTAVPTPTDAHIPHA
jgi:hypothetical protein